MEQTGKKKKLFEWYSQPSTSRRMEDTFGVELYSNERHRRDMILDRKERTTSVRQDAERSYAHYTRDRPPPSTSGSRRSGIRSRPPHDRGYDFQQDENTPALEWRLRPWEAEAHGIKSGSIKSLRRLPNKNGAYPMPSINPPKALSKLPNTNPILYPPGDPRGSHGLQKSISTQRDHILVEAKWKAHTDGTPSSKTLPPLSPESNTSPGLSPKTGPRRSPKLKHAKTSALDAQALRKAKTRAFLGLSPKEEIYSEYDFHRIQSYSAGVAPRQFHKPNVGEPEVDLSTLDALRLFKLEFRHHHNHENPESSDSFDAQNKRVLEDGIPMVSDAILVERRAAIEKLAEKEWLKLTRAEKDIYEEKAKELSEPAPLTVEEQLAKASYTWEEMNESRDWFHGKSHDQVRELKTKLANLDNDMTGLTNVSKNIGSIVVDDYVPGGSPVKKPPPEPTEEERQAMEDAQTVKEINAIMRQVSSVDASKGRPKTQGNVKIWGGGGEEDPRHVEMRPRTTKKARRSSLDIGDRSWQFKSRTSLGNLGVKVRRSSVDSPDPAARAAFEKNLGEKEDAKKAGKADPNTDGEKRASKAVAPMEASSPPWK